MKKWVYGLCLLLLMTTAAWAQPTINPSTYTKTVTTAGTAEALKPTAFRVYWVCIQALSSNTGNVYLGGSDVSSTVGILVTDLLCMNADPPGGWGTFFRLDLNKFFIDVSVNGEGINVLHFQ